MAHKSELLTEDEKKAVKTVRKLLKRLTSRYDELIEEEGREQERGDAICYASAALDRLSDECIKYNIDFDTTGAYVAVRD